ncbi:MAG TPA: aquaporin Z [Polyangia bacterium]
MRKLAGEAMGTFILVFGGCGTAVFAAAFPHVGVGLLGVAFAFGLTVLAGVYAIGPISGAHFNPAVSVGLACARRFAWREVPAYVGAQLFGAIVGAGLVYALANGQPGGYDAHLSGLAANGFGAHSPGHYALGAGLGAEIILTFIFVSVILGATSTSATTAQAGIAIGLTLTLIHLIGIPITNVSVNPARSTGPALFVGGWALAQLWLFWLAPLCGAAVAGLLARWLQATAAVAMKERGEPERARPLPGEPLPTG